MHHTIKIIRNEVHPDATVTVKGTATYPMTMTTNFVAFMDVDGVWMMTDENENPISGAMEADILRALECQL